MREDEDFRELASQARRISAISADRQYSEIRSFIYRFGQLDSSQRPSLFYPAMRLALPDCTVLSPDASRGEYGIEDSACLVIGMFAVIASTHQITAKVSQSIRKIQPVCRPNPGNLMFPLVPQLHPELVIRAFRVDSVETFHVETFSASVIRTLGHIAIDAAMNNPSKPRTSTAMSRLWTAYQAEFYEEQSRKHAQSVPTFSQAYHELLELAGLYLQGIEARAINFISNFQLRRWSLMCEMLLCIYYDLGIDLPPDPRPHLRHWIHS